MIILSIRTDKPEAEVGLYEDQTQLAYTSWEAHRQLAETLHQKIRNLLSQHQKDITDIEGIVVFRGPGSFTGLRIGISVANALAYAQACKIVGTTDKWLELGIERLLKGETDTAVLPEYGSAAHITTPKK